MLPLESLTLTRPNRVQLRLLSIQLPERDEKQRSDHPRYNRKPPVNPNELVLRGHRREDESQRGRDGILELSEGVNETLHLFWCLLRGHGISEKGPSTAEKGGIECILGWVCPALTLVKANSREVM